MVDCLIEITGYKFKKGDLEDFDFLDSQLVFKEYAEDLTEEVEPPVCHNFKDCNSRFIEDCWGLDFKLIRELHDQVNMSGIENEVEQIGWKEFIEPYYDDIVKMLEEEAKAKPEIINDRTTEDKTCESSNPVIITAWKFKLYEHYSFDGWDYETDIDLLGRIDMKSINILKDDKNDSKGRGREDNTDGILHTSS